MVRKRRAVTQISEDLSISIFRKLIPESWVIHEYKPDYGIDCVVELFDYIDSTKTVAETLGENIYIQLKSTKGIQFKKKKLYPHKCVEKYKLEIDKSEYVEIDTLSFSIEVSELLTVQAMGSAVPVLLVLVDIETERAFYVCLNDYIDKIIVPEDPKFRSKSYKTIYIPVHNEIKIDDDYLVPLRFYGKRSKLYAAFTKFHYQKVEIDYLLMGTSQISYSDFFKFKEVLAVFIDSAINLDIWHGHEFWGIIHLQYEELLNIKALLEADVPYKKSGQFVSRCSELWRNLSLLPRTYEETVREWFLPKNLSVEISFRGSVTHKSDD
ncbi:DUF4365 domain-containing protein [uncultured Pseudodesulfovibrio sp.]|uniref:DUF4365 domain-containing protein n=1 Tax=uncultured Pseudodesulfovibrio sp. TaxID=2035858 RepID=UPI0029C96158|nr:DUF4365 domain-containing protein [uncultured Pseudodesulfovibrio sp.]